MVRLTKIYTRTGDDGTTGLATGQRVRKDDPRVEAYGTVDETNAAIGLLMTQSGWAGDAARDERLEAVVRGVIVGGGCQLA